MKGGGAVGEGQEAKAEQKQISLLPSSAVGGGVDDGSRERWTMTNAPQLSTHHDDTSNLLTHQSVARVATCRGATRVPAFPILLLPPALPSLFFSVWNRIIIRLLI